MLDPHPWLSERPRQQKFVDKFNKRTNACYKNSEGECAQNGNHGVKASMICKTTKSSSGKNLKTTFVHSCGD